jgi:hypothetical protein
MLLNSHSFSQGVFQGEKAFGNLGSQNAVVFFAKHIRMGNEPTSVHFQADNLGILRRATHKPPVQGTWSVTKPPAKLPNRYRLDNRGNCGGQTFIVIAGYAVRNQSPGSFRHFRRGLNRSDNDVIGPELLDLFLGFPPDSFADRNKPNDTGNTDENAQYRKPRPQRVKEKTFDAELPRLKPKKAHLLVPLHGLGYFRRKVFLL